MTDLLASLGITPADLQERIIERAVEALLSEQHFDEDGEAFHKRSDLSNRVTEMVTKRINDRIDALAAEHLLPKLTAHIDTLVLQETSKWGEKKGEPMTVVEYLVARCNAYMSEQVDHNGKSQKDGDSYNWRANTTRIAFAIDQHLQYNIKTAMEKSLADANTAMAKGLHEACRVAINQVAEKFKVVATGTR